MSSALLAELERRGLISGVENDAAELEGGVVVTQDTLVEGVHFRLDWLSWRELGFRAAAVNLSDLAASGATPEALIVTAALPPATDVADVYELYEGLGEAGVPVRGGDTTSAPLAMLTVTARRPVGSRPRPGAERGPATCSSSPARSARPARRSARGATSGRRPASSEGRRLGGVAHAMLDLSDGLAVDAAHIARRSGVRCIVDLDSVPLAEDATIEDLGFGEDYELLAAVRRADGRPGHRPRRGRRGRRAAPRRRPYRLRGWEHFSAAP